MARGMWTPDGQYKSHRHVLSTPHLSIPPPPTKKKKSSLHCCSIIFPEHKMVVGVAYLWRRVLLTLAAAGFVSTAVVKCRSSEAGSARAHTWGQTTLNPLAGARTIRRREGGGWLYNRAHLVIQNSLFVPINVCIWLWFDILLLYNVLNVLPLI